MKLGLIADVRGQLGPLREALAELARAGCSRVACLGSTIEGGAEDDAVLAALREADALIVRSPHDAPALEAPEEATLAGLRLGHAPPEALAADEIHWLTGWGVPRPEAVGPHLADASVPVVRGDLYAALLYGRAADGTVRRRCFLRADTVTVDGPFLACPGSVATAGSVRRGGAAMTWDEERRELAVVRFGVAQGEPPRPLVLACCADFSPFRPEPALLERVDLVEQAEADDLPGTVERLRPDLVLLDYHLSGKLSGLDALIALRRGRSALPVPVLAISGNPNDVDAMKSAGVTAALPFTFLADVFARLLREMSPSLGSSPPAG